jgi:hypothetical protein
MVRRIAYRIDLIGGGRQDRTADLRVTNPFLALLQFVA